MKKRYIFVISLLGMLTTACQNDEQWEAQLPDEADLITFSAMPQRTVTRANTYIAYTDENRPTKMGVFGYANQNTVEIFGNTKLEYDSGAKLWKSDKHWADYVAYPDFSFFGYMSSTTDGATLTRLVNNYTLSFPVSIKYPLVTNETALICNNPVTTTAIATPVPAFELDQTLTGFSFSFKLGEKMGNIRKFIVKSVKLYGDGFPTSASNTVSRTYTYSAGNWTAGTITWSSPATKTLTLANAVNIPYVKNDPSDAGYVDDPGTMLVYKDKYRQWGSAHYTIPGIDFTPTIEVTYDVIVENAETHDVVTREDVKSTITLSRTNFSTYTDKTLLPGHVYNVQIQIIPRYLYVLADADQGSGVLLVD